MSSESNRNLLLEMKVSREKRNSRTKSSPKKDSSGERETRQLRTWHRWADATTLHGIKFVFDQDSFVGRRMFWLFVIFAFIFYLCHSVIIQFQRFYSYETVTRTSIIMEENLDFPAVTICGFNQLQNDFVTDYKTRELLKEMYLKETNITAVENLGEDFLKTVNLRDIFSRGLPQLEHTFKECRWIQDTLPCHEVMIKRVTRKGFCYTFGSKKANHSHSLQTIGTNSGVMFLLFANQANYLIGEDDSAGFKIVIHDASDEPDLDAGIHLSPGFTHYIGLQKEEQYFLPAPAKAFGERQCTATHDIGFRNPLEFYDEYSLYACRIECRSRHMNQYCGCVGPFHPGNFSQCDPIKVITCVNEALHTFRIEHDFNACKCPIPCHVTTYHTRVTSAYYPNKNWLRLTQENESSREWIRLYDNSKDWIRDNFLQVRVYFESLGTIRREQTLNFTREDLISSLGGFLGLCIGASVITVLEFLEFCAISLFRCVKSHPINKSTKYSTSNSPRKSVCQIQHI